MRAAWNAGLQTGWMNVFYQRAEPEFGVPNQTVYKLWNH